MIITVIILNLIITIFNIYLAIKIWQLRKLFILITSALLNCENYLYYVLLIAPKLLQQGETNIYHFRRRYQLWQLQLQKIRQIIILLNWLYRLWRRYRVTI